MDIFFRSTYCLYIISTTTITNEFLVYIGSTTDYNKFCRQQSAEIIKNIQVLHDVAINIVSIDKLNTAFPPMSRENISYMETLLTCILKYNYPKIHIYGGYFNSVDKIATPEHAIDNFYDIYYNKHTKDSLFYKIFSIFSQYIINNEIAIGSHKLKLSTPYRTDNDGDVIMWGQ